MLFLVKLALITLQASSLLVTTLQIRLEQQSKLYTTFFETRLLKGYNTLISHLTCVTILRKFLEFTHFSYLIFES